MGRQTKLGAVIVIMVVMVAVLVASTTTADTAEGHQRPRSHVPWPGVTLSSLGAPAAMGASPATCDRPAGCRDRAIAAGSSRRRSGGNGSDGGGDSAGLSTTSTPGGSTGTSTGDATGSGSTILSTTTTTTTRPGTTATGATGGSGGPGTGQTWWVPPAALSWQWELDHPLDLSSASDMGTGVSTYLGTPAPDPTVYDIDGFDNSAATVSALHARGDHVICYIEVGAAENYRSDYSQFPPSDLGDAVSGYPSERYLDIEDGTVVRIIEARIAMCAAKGFDAIEPDIDDSYTDSTGFTISEAQNLQYDATLAAYAHSLGLAWGLKNGDDPSFAAAMEPTADFVLDEQCHQYDTCSSFDPFASAGKAVLEVEYSESPSLFCPAANAADEDALKMDVALSGGRLPCR